MTLTDFASRLNKAKPANIVGRPGFRACCPSHDDKDPSFAVWEGEDGWLHFKCPKCGEGDILGAMGLKNEDRRVEQPSSPQSAERGYVYANAEGLPVMRKRRFMRDGNKTFVLERYDIKNQTYIPGLAGLNGEKAILYCLPEVNQAIKDGRIIHVGEGEKAADRIFRAGGVGTCQAFGADDKPETKWKPIHTSMLHGAHVVVWADRDAIGEKYAAYVASQLSGKALSVKVAQSKTERDKDDAYDHLEAGGTLEDYVLRKDLIPRRGFALKEFTGDFENAEVDFWWEPYFPKGKCVLFDADGGVGKSSASVAFAAALSQGKTPITSEPCEACKTLYLHKGEDQSEELETVFRANGGVPGMISYLDFKENDLIFDAAGLRMLQETIEDGGFHLVVLDAFFYFLQGVVKDTSDNLGALQVMQKLNHIAEATRCTILSIRHTVKDQLNKSASMLGMGTVQYRNSHRGQLVARYHPEQRGLIIVVDEKGSILVERGDTFAFRRVGLEIQFVAEFDNPFAPGVVAKSKVAQAIDFIAQFCDHRFVPVNVVLDAAKEKGFTEVTVKRARAAMTKARTLSRTYRAGTDAQWFLYATKEEDVDPYADSAI